MKMGSGYVERISKEDRGLVAVVVFEREEDCPGLNWGDVWLRRPIGLVRLEERTNLESAPTSPDAGVGTVSHADGQIVEKNGERDGT